MCKAKNHVLSNITALEQEMKNMLVKISDCDKELSDYYHSLEGKVFNAAEGYYLAKNLQKLLRKRRRVKFEASQIKSLIDQLNNVQLKLDQNEQNYFRKAPSNYKEYIYVD